MFCVKCLQNTRILYDNSNKFVKGYNGHSLGNQDGSVGRHTVPPGTTRTDRKSNGKEIWHQVDKKETYIQTSRRGRDGHQGREDSCDRGGTEADGVWDERGRQSDH